MPGSMRNSTLQTLLMRVRNPHGIVPTSAEAPSHYTSHVKDPLLPHPVQYTVLQSIRALRVLWIRRAVSRPRNLGDDTAPPSL